MGGRPLWVAAVGRSPLESQPEMHAFEVLARLLEKRPGAEASSRLMSLKEADSRLAVPGQDDGAQGLGGGAGVSGEHGAQALYGEENSGELRSERERVCALDGGGDDLVGAGAGPDSACVFGSAICGEGDGSAGRVRPGDFSLGEVVQGLGWIWPGLEVVQRRRRRRCWDGVKALLTGVLGEAQAWGDLGHVWEEAGAGPQEVRHARERLSAHACRGLPHRRAWPQRARLLCQWRALCGAG